MSIGLARHAIGRGQEIGFQTAVVGIIDRMELEGGRMVGMVAGEDGTIEDER